MDGRICSLQGEGTENESDRMNGWLAACCLFFIKLISWLLASEGSQSVEISKGKN